MSKASMARAIAKAGKKQEAQTRGLTGNRNAQGDFMTGENQLDTDRFAASEMMARDNTVDAVTPDLQNYIEDVKAQIDELEARMIDVHQDLGGTNVHPDDKDYYDKTISSLQAQQDKLVDDLITKLEEEGVTVPDEIRDWEEVSLGRGAEYSADEFARREPEFDSPLAHDMNQFYSQQ